MLRGTAVAGASLWLCGSGIGAERKSPNDKLNIAVIGCGGQGKYSIKHLKDQNIVAMCDVDRKRAAEPFKQFPKVKKFWDYRRMLDKMDKQIDAVVVATPDHTHFHPSMMAMEMGKHLYCEKPMAHSVAETRAMTELAAKKKLATQLGVQRHAFPNMHRVVELIQAGTIGPVAEVYAWMGGDRGMPPMPTKFPRVPKHLKWDLWIGPAPMTKYTPEIAPYKWRFWWNYGSGDMGNWGCHILDIPFWALGLRYPTKVAASGPAVDKLRTPKSMDVVYEFPARGSQPPVKLHWSHIKKGGPAILKKKKLPRPGRGVLFIGTKGMLLCDFNKRTLFPKKKFADLQPPAKTIPDSPGFHKEWVEACKGGPAATCDFAYSGPLSETVTLGNVAYLAGHEFAWDGSTMGTPGSDDVQPLLRSKYRKGWEI
jgi:predicted dehydrogenase